LGATSPYLLYDGAIVVTARFIVDGSHVLVRRKLFALTGKTEFGVASTVQNVLNVPDLDAPVASVEAIIFSVGGRRPERTAGIEPEPPDSTGGLWARKW
jgi:hypothetical protein